MNAQASINLTGIDGVSELGPHLKDYAVAAEAAGVQEFVLADHVLLADDGGGRTPFGPQSAWPDPFVLLSVIGAATSTAVLATDILVAPLRPAPVIAKMAATLDVLTGGRFELGIGLGWQRQEFAACGVPFDQRGVRVDDTISACRALWHGGASTFTSPTVSFTDVWSVPKPVRGADLPLWIGGSPSEALARRVVQHGAGWTASGRASDDQVEAGVDLLRAALADAGRDPGALRLRVNLMAADGREATLREAECRLRRLRDLPVARVCFLLSQYVPPGGDTLQITKDLVDLVRGS